MQRLTGFGAVGILRMGATKLVHKIGDHTMKVETIVKSRIGKVDKITASNWHLLGIQLGLEGSHRSSESSSRHGDG